MTLRFLIGIATGFIGFFWCIHAAMAEGIEHQPLKTEKFKDWHVVCQNLDQQKSCQLLLDAHMTETGETAFLVSIFADSATNQHYAVITVPTGVYLVPGIEIRVDRRRRAFKAAFELCDQKGCHAGFRLAGPVLRAFKKGMKARFRVWTGKTTAVEFPISLYGFSAAYRHSQKQLRLQ